MSQPLFFPLLALTAIGPPARKALPALRAALEDTADDTFEGFVRCAIRSIEGS